MKSSLKPVDTTSFILVVESLLKNKHPWLSVLSAKGFGFCKKIAWLS